MAQKIKIFTKELGTQGQSLEDQFNNWTETVDIQVLSTQFLSFNKLNTDNSIDKQYISLTVLYFPVAQPA
jgi:hypothetical protein